MSDERDPEIIFLWGFLALLAVFGALLLVAFAGFLYESHHEHSLKLECRASGHRVIAVKDSEDDWYCAPVVPEVHQ